MADTYDLTTPVGKVRLRIPDRDTQAPIFKDAELQCFLDDNGGDVLLAAAEALETIAGDPQRIQAYRRGAVSATQATPAELLARAKGLRSQSAQKGGGILVGTIERGDFYEDA